MRSPFQFEAVEEETPDSWKLKGSCRQRHPDGTRVHDPEIFHPAKRAERYQRAGKAVCAHCPVQIRCREYALERYEFGIWGGLSEHERRHLQGISGTQRFYGLVRSQVG